VIQTARKAACGMSPMASATDPEKHEFPGLKSGEDLPGSEDVGAVCAAARSP
jgi:hypothetical protein